MQPAENRIECRESKSQLFRSANGISVAATPLSEIVIRTSPKIDCDRAHNVLVVFCERELAANEIWGLT
jgi:hypothetical protein